MKVGILSLQGDFLEHTRMVERLGHEAHRVRLPEDLQQVDCLIIPGGESTTMAVLMTRYKLMEAIQQRAREGMPILGTCAGAIVMAKEIDRGTTDQARLGIMEIRVVRNAFGRQVDSFEADLQISKLGVKPFRGVFIRAPYIVSTSGDVEVLARLDDKIVMVQQGNMLAAAFHPELTDDARVHEYFLSLCSLSTP